MMEWEVQVLARTIYGEARGEGRAGMEAVANVIMNRLDAGQYGSTVAEICMMPWQFSCWNKDDPNRNLILTHGDSIGMRKALAIAHYACAGLLEDKTNGATHYCTKQVEPYWAEGKTPCAEIGNHRFYNDID